MDRTEMSELLVRRGSEIGAIYLFKKSALLYNEESRLMLF